MTHEEARRILTRDDAQMRKGYFSVNDFVAIEKARDALERLVPVKPNYRKVKYGEPDGGGYNYIFESEYTCSICGRYVHPKNLFCVDCGQAIDWREVE